MKIIGLLLLCFIAYSISFAIRETWRRKSIPKKSTDQLKSLFANRRNYTLFHQTLLELKKREENTDFAFPHLLDLALCKVSVMELVGKGCLETHFKEKLMDIDFSSKGWNPKDREFLQEIKNKMS